MGAKSSILKQLRDVGLEVSSAQRHYSDLLARRIDLIDDALAEGHTATEIATALVLTRGRLSQLTKD